VIEGRGLLIDDTPLELLRDAADKVFIFPMALMAFPVFYQAKY
jgi:hypothetical protein